MLPISFTKNGAHLRSTPFDTDGLPTSNIITDLPAFHPVTVIGITNGDWAHVRTVLANERLEGYVFASLLRESAGLAEPTPHSPMMTQRDAILLDRDAAALKDHLTIRRPSVEVGGSQALAVKRSRRVEVSLKDVMDPKLTAAYRTPPPDAGPGAGAVVPPSTTFREAGGYHYFRRHWMSLWNQAIPAQPAKFFTKDDFCTVVVALESVRPAPGVVVAPSWGERWSRQVVTWSTPTQGFALHHPTAKRSFLLVPKDGMVLVEADFETPAAFASMLDKKVAAIRQCVRAAALADHKPEHLLTEASTIDLGPALIIRQASELDALESFTTKLAETADTLGASAVNQLLDESQVNALIRAVLTMKAPDVERRLRKAELIDRSSALGYKLADAPGIFKFEDGSEFVLEKGSLYRPYQTQITWETEHRQQMSYSDSGFIFGIGASSGSREWTEFVRHYKTVTKYDKVLVDLDPFSDEEERLSSLGFENFRFERVGGQYRTAEGVDLEEVMLRCEYDEAFRIRCAVWLPVYEQKISKGVMLTKYTIVKRPHLGIQPVRMPKVYFEETLSYRTSWEGAELGELVYTMNLGPGEERTVTVEQRTSRSLEDVRSTVSILDLTEANSQELTSEIEKEARSNSDQSSSNSWSVSAAGIFGGFGGSASTAGENRMSTSQFARSFEKIAKKAASNITKNTRQEVRSSSTGKSEASRTEATTIKIRNINDGRTLNLLFYRLYNILNTGIHAEDLGFVAERGVEIISGSGITLPQIVPLEELSRAFAPFDLGSLPFEVDSSDADAQKATFLAYWHLVLSKFLALLEKEYAVSAGLLGTLDAADTVALGLIKTALLPRVLVAADTLESLAKEVHGLLLSLERLLVSMVEKAGLGRRDSISTGQQLRVASPGLYVDSLMGLRPATEPYSEEMRAQTVLMKAAEVEKERALASYYRFLSRSAAPGGASDPYVVVDARVRSGVVHFTTNVELRAGSWSLIVDGLEVASVEWPAGAMFASVEVSSAESWLVNLDAHVFLLRHASVGEVIALVMRQERSV